MNINAEANNKIGNLCLAELNLKIKIKKLYFAQKYENIFSYLLIFY
jgi:hypothetical protein